jgi:hypothetical protein
MLCCIQPADMAKIIYGYTCFILGIISFLMSAAILLILFGLPPATYLFLLMLKLAYIPLIISCIGLFFYFLQWRIFIVKIVTAGLILNTIALFSASYILYGLYNSI